MQSVPANDGSPTVDRHAIDRATAQRVVAAVARRPELWVEAVQAMAGMARRGWWRQPPYLPLPDSDYLAWRIATAYGTEMARVEVDDVISYLAWRKRQPNS